MTGDAGGVRKPAPPSPLPAPPAALLPLPPPLPLLSPATLTPLASSGACSGVPGGEGAGEEGMTVAAATSVDTNFSSGCILRLPRTATSLGSCLRLTPELRLGPAVPPELPPGLPPEVPPELSPAVLPAVPPAKEYSAPPLPEAAAATAGGGEEIGEDGAPFEEPASPSSAGMGLSEDGRSADLSGTSPSSAFELSMRDRGGRQGRGTGRYKGGGG